MTVPFGRYTLAPGPEWAGAVATWPLVTVSRETEPGHMLVDKEHLEREGKPLRQVHLTCGKDGQSVACLIPDLGLPGYITDAASIQAGILAHLRQCHEAEIDTAAS